MPSQPAGYPEAPGPSDPGNDRAPRLARQVRQTDASPRTVVPKAQFDHRLSNLMVSAAASEAISGVLGRLVQDCRASTGMVLDRAGQIIVSEGTTYRDELIMLGALVAGTYASTREMARILHEDNFRMLLQEGARENIFTQAIGDHWLVSVIFDEHTHLGLVKVLCERATTDLSHTLVVVLEENQQRLREHDSTLARVVEDTIDLIFRKDDA